jgi:hypothetical protein
MTDTRTYPAPLRGPILCDGELCVIGCSGILPDSLGTRCKYFSPIIDLRFSRDFDKQKRIFFRCPACIEWTDAQEGETND